MKNKIVSILFLIIVSHQLQAQGYGQWTWMKGSNVSGGSGIFGTIGVSSTSNNPPDLYEAAEWTDLNGNFWLFGGISGPNLVGINTALWKFDPLINQWTWIHGSSASSPAVYGTKGVPSPGNTPGWRGYGAVSWVDNTGDFWLFGGYGQDAFGINGALNDLWRYNVASDQWTWMNGSNAVFAPIVTGTKGVANAANTPNGRTETNAGVTDGLGNLWLFGGLNSANTAYNDVWKYNIASNMWTWVAGNQNQTSSPVYGTMGVSAATNDPGDRFSYTKFIDAQNNLYFLGAGLIGFGGSNVVDVWRFSPTTTEWTWVGGSNVLNNVGSYINKCDTNTVNVPKAKFEIRASWSDSCGFFFFGGFDVMNNSYNDLWYYNIENNKFTWLSGTSIGGNLGNYGTIGVSAATNLPPSRGGAVAFKDKQFNLWLFGGLSGSSSGWSFLGDLWRFKLDPMCGKLCSKSTFNPALAANFYANTVCGNAPLTVQFNNSSTSATTYTWNYGDGSSLGNTANPAHTYAANGTYTVSLTAQGTGTATSTTVKNAYIYVGPMPTAGFTTLANDTVCLNSLFSFNNLSQDSIVTNNWSFGDGQTAATSNTSHQFLLAGTYTVSLIVTDNHHCVDTATQKVVVLPAPDAQFTQTPNVGCPTLKVIFTNNSTGATNYIWNFGDTQTTTITNPTHNYNNPGTYSISLIAANSIGCKDTAVSTVLIHPKPDASFTVTGYNGCFPYAVNAFANTLGLSNYQWIINGTSTSVNDSILLGTIDNTLVKNITLITTNAFGCKDTVTVSKTFKDDNCNNIFIPNVFTPNGDGTNNFFTVKAVNYKSYHMVIYDRWGLRLFETTDVNTHWNGKAHNTGGDCPDGTYFYIINLIDKNDKTSDYKGFLNVFR